MTALHVHAAEEISHKSSASHVGSHDCEVLLYCNATECCGASSYTNLDGRRHVERVQDMSLSVHRKSFDGSQPTPAHQRGHKGGQVLLQTRGQARLQRARERAGQEGGIGCESAVRASSGPESKTTRHTLLALLMRL